MIEPELSGDFGDPDGLGRQGPPLKVRANAETPLDARTAREFGAEGIGLCRTEHMFFDADRIAAVREMILADDEKGRRRPWPRCCRCSADFVELFNIMEGLPVTIRLLDPPLHEFLPHTDEEIDRPWPRPTGIDAAKLRAGAKELHETNPMLGHRGCRLGVTYPEIYEMQVRAIFEAAARSPKKARARPAGAGDHAPAGRQGRRR
jgi:pyruvate,orthophosphate dikinase